MSYHLNGMAGSPFGLGMIPSSGLSDYVPTLGAGLGCACGCGKCNQSGLGLFDNGFDPSTFAWQEWSIVGVVGYMVISTIFGTKRAVGAIARVPQNRRRKKAASLRAQADELTRKKGSRRKTSKEFF